MYRGRLDIKKRSFILLLFLMSAAFLVVQVEAVENADAIAVRVVPNPSHYSIETWYRQQGYQGSPQKMTVDGYEAIRDGRTVFINAANVENNNIYTNIYLISYNQEPNTKTVDILGQLVSHWKFNNNLSQTGSCSISKIYCTASSNCPESHVCSNGQTSVNPIFNISNKGKCLLSNGLACLSDGDCPTNLFCDSPKSKVIRDVKRLGQLNDIKNSLSTINAKDLHYPDLNSGTYIPGTSISTWPSWSETLWPKLAGLTMSVDPINILGDCPGFEAVSCWRSKGSNDNTNSFYKIDNNGKALLPNGSYAYIYSSEKNGSNYSLCASFETLGLYDTAEGQLSSKACPALEGYSGSSVNTAPIIKNYFLEGNGGQEFNGYVQASDNENDAISWQIETGNTDFSSWSALPVLRDSGINNQKKIYAKSAGNKGDYPVTLILSDSRGATQGYPLTLKISSNKPIIEAVDMEYSIDPVNPLNYSFYIQSVDGILNYSIKIKTGTPDVFAGTNSTKTDLSYKRWKVDLSALIPTNNKITEDRKLVYTITATGKNNAVSTKDVLITLKIEKPHLDFDCDTNGRVNQLYPINGIPCLIGGIKEVNHSISYSKSEFIGLNLENINSKIFLRGTPPSLNPIGSPITITATNEYGVSLSKSFNIKVNNYCGDGVLQTPNTEGKGGALNDGREQCDGLDATTRDVTRSSILLQYGCSTKVNESIYPILDGNSCVFLRANNGGGYCGDGLCQFKINEVNIENSCNCEVDCGKPIVDICSTCGPGTYRLSADTACVSCPTDYYCIGDANIKSPCPTNTFSKAGSALLSDCKSNPCGNGILDSGEECDGNNLNNKNCQNINPNYGIYGLSCNSNCKLITSSCYSKNCYRNSDCPSNSCLTQGLSTATYYCTSTLYSHRCFFSTKATCESAKQATDPQGIKHNCDWVVQFGRCGL